MINFLHSNDVFNLTAGSNAVKFDTRKVEGQSFDTRKVEGQSFDNRKVEGQSFDTRKVEGQSFDTRTSRHTLKRMMSMLG